MKPPLAHHYKKKKPFIDAMKLSLAKNHYHSVIFTYVIISHTHVYLCTQLYSCGLVSVNQSPVWFK